MVLGVQTNLITPAFSFASTAGSFFAGANVALGSSVISSGFISNNIVGGFVAAAVPLHRCPAAVFANESAAAAFAIASVRAASVYESAATVSMSLTDRLEDLSKARSGLESASDSPEEAVAVPPKATISHVRPVDTLGQVEISDRATIEEYPSEMGEEPFALPDYPRTPERDPRGVAIIGDDAVISIFDVDFTLMGSMPEFFSFERSSEAAIADMPRQGSPAMRSEGRAASTAALEAVDAKPSGLGKLKAIETFFRIADGLMKYGVSADSGPDSADAFDANGFVRSARAAIEAKSDSRKDRAHRKFISEIARLVSVKAVPSDIPALRDVTKGRTVVVERNTDSGSIEAHFAEHNGRLVFAGFESADDLAFIAQPDIAPDMQRVGRISHDGMIVMGLGQPGGESLFGKEPLEIDDPEVVERLTSLILAQLREGPASLANGEMLRQFNAFVRARLSNGSSAPHTPEEWESYLREALVSAVKFALPFDERGSRSIIQIEADAARALGMDIMKLSEWEEHFGTEFISEHLFESYSSLATEFKESSPKADLATEFVRGIESMAKKAMGMAPDPAVSFADEAGVQWSMARAGMVEGLTAKADFAAKLITELRMAGRRGMASRALAIIFRASEASESAAREDALIARWSEAELAAVIKRLMNDETWDVASHRSFRMHLSPPENALVNKLVEMANMHNVVDVMRSVDLTKEPVDRIWDALDSSGQAEAIEDNVVQRMVYMMSNEIVEASLSEDIN